MTLRSVQDDSTFQNPVLAVVMGERNMEDSRRKSLAVKAGMERRRDAASITAAARHTATSTAETRTTSESS